MELEIHSQFPLISSWKNKTYWNGFIKVQNTLVKLAITAPNYPSAKAALLEGDQDTSDLINVGKTKSELTKILNTDITVLKLLEFFRDLVENALEGKSEASIQVWDPQIYSFLVNELQEIGFNNIPFVSTDLKEIHVNQLDPSGRIHTVKFFISHMYPRKGLKVLCDLPSTEANITWPNNITDSLNSFTKYLEKYDKFWAEIREIDERVQVLDPFEPNPSHVHRRILMGNKVILHVIVNPLKPRDFPSLQFYGPEARTEELENSVTQNCNQWSDSRGLLDNLQRILGVEFPAKGFEMVTADEVKCTICYMYELEGDPPEKTCACGSLYHNKCLYELFINESADNIRRKTVDCPVCAQEIPLQ